MGRSPQKETNMLFGRLVTALLVLVLSGPGFSNASQVLQDSTAAVHQGAPVIFEGDTLFTLYGRLGPFSPQQRCASIGRTLDDILRRGLDPSSIHVVEQQGYSDISLGGLTIMAVTNGDAAAVGQTRAALSESFRTILQKSLAEAQTRYTLKTMLVNIGLIFLFVAIAFILLWGMRKFMPRLYAAIESWEGVVIRPLKFRKYELLKAGTVTALLIVLLKGLRLAATLIVLYFLITLTLAQFPLTRDLNVRPALIGIFLAILTTTIAYVLFKGILTFFGTLSKKIEGWKGTVIQPVKVKTVEVISIDRIAVMVVGAAKLLRWVVVAALIYFYISLLFSFFEFTNTWAGTLIGYIVNPLINVSLSFVRYLPHLFFILVIVYVTRYAIKFVKLIFDALEKETFKLPGFYGDWAVPTYKIVRFLIIAFAAIIIFPYLPGSSSPVFQGISVFIGVLFSLGSTSAISNIVAGTVITYMRPFKIGDRVRIADTVGDVVEKTLLVTRIRTIKNVDVTVPNAMVLGSHIINFSSSAGERGLILHTGVTIGYDVPWNKVHQLLIAAADATDNVLKDPKPFVLQTSLDDSYVSYEINAYTDKPNIMAQTYSELHQNIQDKFNEAAVEILSPHYSAIRDGNKSTVPDPYLPKSYSAPGFRLFPWLSTQGKKESEGEGT